MLVTYASSLNKCVKNSYGKQSSEAVLTTESDPAAAPVHSRRSSLPLLVGVFFSRDSVALIGALCAEVD